MRARIPAAILGLTALVLTACGGGEAIDMEDPAGEAPPPETAEEPEPAADGVLVAAIGGDPDQLDPHTTTSSFAFTVLENVYDTLVQPGDDLTMEGALAESWETSDDLLTWTFNLRDGVQFHDGSPLTADDVIASLQRIADEGQNAWRLTMIDEMNAVDELTVELVLSRVAPNLLEQIGAFKGLAIAPASAIEADTLGDEPVGTGPFRYVSFTPGDNVVLERFDDYWGGTPALSGIEFRVIPDQGVKLTNLETGEVDWIDSVAPEQIDALVARDDVVLGQVAGLDYHYIALNNARPPFDDVRVRQAIAFAIDIDTLTEAAQFGAATPNETAIPPTSFWYHEYAPYGHDPDAARDLLEEAGVGDLEIDLMVSSDFPETVTAAQVLESQLGEVGISVSIRSEDFSTWLDEQGEGNFDAFLLSWIGNIDPDDFYYAQHHSEGGFNFQGFADGEVDELLDSARVEVDEAARKALYDQAAERIVDLASYIYFYNSDILEAWSPRVQGYETRPDQATRFVDASLS
jgi:peptide/nickel transport system substrate-binding protein